MHRSYLAFKPLCSSLSQALLRAENVELIHTAWFAHNRFSGYDFSADLALYVWSPNEETVLSGIELFLKAGGIING